jgi:hypothetical protein
MSWAFKEWHAVVGALIAGTQSILLRKGGIAEASEEFKIPARRFWLLPTHFHAQADKIKPVAATRVTDASGPIELAAYAELRSHRFLASWAEVEAWDDQHIWTADTLRDRFHWSQPPGINLMEVDVFRLDVPIPLPAEMIPAGCKSWVEIAFTIEDHRATRVSPSFDT